MTAPPTPATPETAKAAYESRRAFWTAEAARHDRQLERLGSARLLVFFATLLAGTWIVRAHPGWAAWLLVPVGLFVALVALHAQSRERLARARRGAAWHERNLARLDDRWAGTGPTGEEHASEQHLFARDLDVVGEGSLFQLLCTTRSRCGEVALARWLLGAPTLDAGAIRARQQAVAALAPEAELRERFALAGDEVASGLPSDLDPRALRAWAAAEPVRFAAVERGTALVLGGLAAAAAATWATGATDLLALLLVATAEALFAQVLKRRMRCVDRLAESGEHALSLLAQLLSLLEERTRRPATPPALAELGAAVGVPGAQPGGAAAEPASARIARFDALARSLASGRRNGVYALFAFLLQIRVHQAHALERWRAQVGPALSGWLDAVGEFEALLALAGYAHEHPDDVFPDIVTAPSLHASGLGHPLLPTTVCVRNDVALDGEHALLLVSGSNMSGKSTLLRAVGLAAVLGQAGAPVRARGLRFSPVQVGACISIHDSLREGSSRFWAEITRLRALDDVARGGRPLLFLLDELLSGTNSHDRLLGARGVLRQLLAHGAIGIVTTHDLALAQLADELAPRATNAHFEDRLQDERMVFDYRMRPGVVERGNALALMRSLGLLGDAGQPGRSGKDA
jgi:hypothetical protein